MNQYSQLLWYRQPSQDGFNEAMVIGNGRLGASLCGYPKKERIYLNEATFWSGGPGNNIMPGAKEHLEELRKAIFDGDFQKAQEITNRYFVCGIGDAKSGMIFQPVGELTIEMSAPADDENATNYYRYLSTENSETGCEYRVGNVQYQREGFASHPDDIIVLKYTADQPQSISFRLDFHSEHTHKAIAKDNRLYFLGKGSDAKGVKGVLSVCAVAEIRAQNGTVSALGSTLSVNGADSAEILLSIATSYKTPYDVSLNAEQKAVEILDAALQYDYLQLKQRHQQDYQKLYDRVKIEVPAIDGLSDLPTDERLKRFSKEKDPSFAALFFNFSRYLLISCSRSGGQPATLQGLWNPYMTPAWDSKYTTNINLQMNYWGAYPANLAECAEPFIDKVITLQPSGHETAEKLYDIHRGWVLHHNTDLWNITAPVDGPWGMTPTCGVWLCCQLFDIYRYNRDDDYLRRVFETIKGAVVFMLDYLVPHREPDGTEYLVTCPATSPENVNHRTGSNLSYATAFDISLIYELFIDYIEAAKHLGTGLEILEEVESALAKLPPAVRIGKWGQICEWNADDDDYNDSHRHLSHLVGLYPGEIIDRHQTPEFAKAAEITLERRTLPGDWTGWGISWRICMFSRLERRDKVQDMMGILFENLIMNNLLGAHPLPSFAQALINKRGLTFQIDCNLGYIAGFSEMLVSSTKHSINLLGGLPAFLEDGKVSGLRAKDGFTIREMEWKNGRLERAVITSQAGKHLKVYAGDLFDELDTEIGKDYLFTGGKLTPLS